MMNLKEASTNELFTELMKRVPPKERVCLFVNANEGNYDNGEYSLKYKLYNISNSSETVIFATSEMISEEVHNE